MRSRLLLCAFFAGILGLLAFAAALRRTHASGRRDHQRSRPSTTFDLRESLVLRDAPVTHPQKVSVTLTSPAFTPRMPEAPDKSGRECCSIEPLPPLNVSLTYPVPMLRPIHVFMQTGHVDAAWPCDVPCEYSTSLPAKGDVDVIVGEAGAPNVPAEVRRLNPSVLTAARSMESSINYPLLRQLPTQVGAAMTTSLSASTVPVVYLSRSSVRKWGTPAVWNGDMPTTI